MIKGNNINYSKYGGIITEFSLSSFLKYIIFYFFEIFGAFISILHHLVKNNINNNFL